MQELLRFFGSVRRFTILSFIILSMCGFFIASSVSAANLIVANNKITPDHALYKKKLAKFLIQEKQKSSPKLIYNLGVIYYKLQKYSLAQSYFKKLLLVNRYHLIAKYNLGLVAYKLGNTAESIKWFQRISGHKHNFGDINNIQRLAKVQIDKLLNTKPIAKKNNLQAMRFKNYLFAYYGHDDSLSDPDGQTTTVDDSFLNVYATLNLNLDESVAEGVSWKFSLYSKDYTHLNSYDYKVVSTDFSRLVKINNWHHSAGLRLDSSTYGATDYQSTVRAELKTQFRSSSHKLATRYRYYDISSEDILYDAYEGNQQRLDFIYDLSFKPHKIKLDLGFEINDRADTATQSYSATRTKIQTAWTYRINKTWKSQLKYEYRDSRYNDMNLPSNVVRDETRSISSIQLKYHLDKKWWLVSDFRYTENDSNINSYSYTRNETRIGISGSF